MKSFRQHIKEQPEAWHESIRSNSINLSPEDSKTANAYLKLAYKTAKHTPMYLDTLSTLHGFLTRKGVSSDHPTMRELSNIHADTTEMYQNQVRRDAHAALEKR